MPDTRADQKSHYPLPVYNYRVQVDGETMRFTEVSGIAVEYDTVTYRHGLSYAEGERIQAFRFDSFSSVTLKRGVVLGSSPLFLYKWLKDKESRPLVVSLMEAEPVEEKPVKPVLSWKIEKAVPVKLEAPGFEATSNDAAIESLELQVRGISIVEG